MILNMCNHGEVTKCLVFLQKEKVVLEWRKQVSVVEQSILKCS